MPTSPASRIFRAVLTAILSVLLLCVAGIPGLAARDFSVAVYNVENLFDVDGRATYDDYQASLYGPAHLSTKLSNICAVLRGLTADGRGPDIVLLCELEVDQTPPASPKDLKQLLAAAPAGSYRDLLASPLSLALRDWPVEAWLLKALEDEGLSAYQVVIGSDSPASPYADGNPRAIKCAVLTRFPVVDTRELAVPNARNILEVALDIDGHTLRVFTNHWKSGAGDARMERLREADARVLRRRLDALLAEDPNADILLGGDFNSQYNQRQRNPRLQSSAIEDVLGSQGRELALQRGEATLYNLWYELPPDQRGSDVYQNEWGTLMQLLLTPGLYDQRGLQYVDNSFRVGRLPGLNAASDGTPLRWAGAGVTGSGFSDHFPVLAEFTTTSEGSPDRWLRLIKPSEGELPGKPTRVNTSLADLAPQAITLDSLSADTELRDPRFLGKLFLVEAKPLVGQRLSVRTRFGEFEVFARDKAFRDRLRQEWKRAERVRFYGELGQYQGRWQFLLKDESWSLDLP